MMKRHWSDDEIRQMREERSMGAKHREICRKWEISGGHLERILNGTARAKAGGPISTGELLPTVVHGKTSEEIDIEAKLSEERFVRLIEKQAQREMDEPIPERALGYGARPRVRVDAELVATLKKIHLERDMALSDSGVPLPPDWKEFQTEETVVKQSDADRMLDELINKG